MLSRTFLRRVPPNAMRVKQYLEHLYATEGRELVPMADLMPAAGDGMAQAIEFQRQFIENQVKQHGPDAAIRAWTCTLPGDGLLRNMGHMESIVAPVPSDMVTVSAAPYSLSSSSSNDANSNSNKLPTPLVTISKKRRRVQSVELTLACQLDPETMASPEPKIVRVAPAALIRGSRYPFYAPNTPGFASDLSSCVHLAVGSAVDFNTLNFDLLGMGAVLSHEVEPVAVGYIHKFNLDAAAAAAQHIQTNFDQHLRKLGVGPGSGGPRGSWWFATGCLARVPVGSIGRYKADFGLLGSVVVQLRE